jgi:streptomycin 6-kinase
MDPAMIRVPAALQATRALGPRWSNWLDVLPARTEALLREWDLRPEGPEAHGSRSLVVPVRTGTGRPAVLKVALPDDGGAQEHLALRYWAGNGAVELLRADPHRAALLLERLDARDLADLWDLEACEVVGELYPRLHVPAPPQLRTLAAVVSARTEQLRALDHDPALPRRLVEQAVSLGAELAADPASTGTLIHTDLHYGNVLSAARGPWLAIDPEPLSGDPHFEPAPMLWNRWEELAGQVREGVRRRFHTLVDVAGFDEDRARAWVVVRMVHNAMAEITGAAAAGRQADRAWLTTCVAVIKAVQG